MAKTELSELSAYDRLVIEQGATDVYSRFIFSYQGQEIEVFVEFDFPGEKSIVRLVSVLDAVTGEPVEYEESAIYAEVEKARERGDAM